MAEQHEGSRFWVDRRGITRYTDEPPYPAWVLHGNQWQPPPEPMASAWWRLPAWMRWSVVIGVVIAGFAFALLT